MSKFRRRYTKEEKLEIVNLSLEEHISNEELGERFNIHANTISRWRREYLRNQQGSFPGKRNKNSERKHNSTYPRLRNTR